MREGEREIEPTYTYGVASVWWRKFAVELTGDPTPPTHVARVLCI